MPRKVACLAVSLGDLSPMPVMKANQRTLKSRALDLVRKLPEEATWDDLMHEIYVRQKIEAGLKDVEEGRVYSHASIKREFGARL